MYCENCGHKLDDDSIFCCECGARVETDTEHLPPEINPRKTHTDVIAAIEYFFSTVGSTVSSAFKRLRTFLPPKQGKIVLFILAAVLIIVFALTVLLCSGSKADEQDLFIPNSDLQDFYIPDIQDDNIANDPANTLPSPDSGSQHDLRWLLAPEIQVDDIQVLYCGYPVVYSSGTRDINSMEKHKYDRICLFEKDGSYGLINYNGGIITGMACDQIVIGNKQCYVMSSQSGDNTYYYTLTSRYEAVQIDEHELYDNYLPDRTYYCWIDSYGGLCICENDEIKPYTGDFSGQTAVPYYDNEYVLQGYRLLSAGMPINDILYEGAGAFFGGIIPVCLDGKWGYINADGNQILPFDFEVPPGWSRVNYSECYPPYNASDGYIVVFKSGEYAMFDSSGEPVIDFGVFEEIRPVYEGMCWAKQNGKWGVLAIDDEASLPESELPQKSVLEKSAAVHSNSGLRMREGPGTDYNVIDILPDGENVTVCGYTNDWSYIRKGNLYGWVKTEYIE